MKISFLKTAQPGLRWFHRYYRENPQLRKPMALAAFRKARSLVKDNPYIGQVYEGIDNVRTYPLQGTVFSFLYTVTEDTVWIIDVHDQRGYRSAEALRHFTAELRQRMRGEG